MHGYELTSNTAKQDNFSDSFTKFALDSLKNVKDWEFIVNGIDDNEFASNPIARNMLEGQPIYNLKLISIIDPSAITADTLSIDNYANFIITVPKKPNGALFIKQVELIKSLNSGDTVLVSGDITYVNNQLKVDFSDVVKDIYSSNIDILASDIKRKH